MNKKLLVLMGTSTFALSGCFSLIGMGIGAVAESGKGKRVESAQFADLNTRFDKADRELAELSDDLEELEKTHETWWNLYTAIDHHITSEEFGYKKIGSCLKERKNSDNCKKAVVMRGKVAHKIADVLHAAIEAKPVYGKEFPAFQIVHSQEYPEIAAVVDVEDSLTKVVENWSGYWAKRVKKAGGAETLARKEGAGVCFFSDAPQGDKLKPRFAFTGKDDMFMRCAAPQSLSSYERTEKDLVVVKMFGHHGHVKVDTQPGDGSSDSASHTSELSMSAFRKGMKANADDSTDEKPWRFVLANVTYYAFQKVGTHAVDNGNGVTFRDDIREHEIASGIAVIDMEAAGADDDADDDADEEEDADEKPAKKSRTAQRPTKKRSRSK